jgi:PII-like signaling protein
VRLAGADARAACVRLVERARACGLTGATATRALAGDERFVVELVDSAEAIDAFLSELPPDAAAEISDVEIVKRGVPRKVEGKAQVLQIFVEAVDQWEGEPLHEALVKRLHLLDVASVTVERGLMGYGASGRIHKHKVLRHDEPIVIAVVDSAEKIAQVMPAIDHMLGGGMAVLFEVDLVPYR